MTYFKLISLRSISIEISVTKRPCSLQRLCTVDDIWPKCDVWKTGGKYWQVKTEYFGISFSHYHYVRHKCHTDGPGI